VRQQPALGRPSEPRERRPAGKTKEMARAGAVAGSETRDGSARFRQASECFRPLVLPGNGVGGEPNGPQGSSCLQVVYVPPRPGRPAEMMAAARLEAAGTEGAAGIRIPARPEAEDSELAHLEPPGAWAIEDQGIGPWRSRDRLVFGAFNAQEGHTSGPCLRKRLQRPAVPEAP